MVMKPKCPPVQILIRLIQEGYTTNQIAIAYGVHIRTIYNWKRKLRLSKGTSRDNRFDFTDYDLWFKLRFEENIPCNVIAEKFECSSGYVYEKTNELR